MVKVNKDVHTVPPSLKSKTTDKHRKQCIENQQYDKKRDSSYKGNDVRQALKAIYSGKCAFCEQEIEQFHVEHYRPKSTYYWLAFSWDNLLLSCPTCNEKKGIQFEIEGTQVFYKNEDYERIHTLAAEYAATEQPKMIHPEHEDPEPYLRFGKDGSISSTDNRVQYTIDTCELWRPELEEKRKKLLDDLRKKIFERRIQAKLGDRNAVAKIQGALEDFVNDAKDPTKPYLAFRRYVIKHVLREVLQLSNQS